MNINRNSRDGRAVITKSRRGALQWGDEVQVLTRQPTPHNVQFAKINGDPDQLGYYPMRFIKPDGGLTAVQWVHHAAIIKAPQRSF